jgi:hypothetical protein
MARDATGTLHAVQDELTSVVGILLDLGMPPHEVDAIMATDQPVHVHRYLELHGERLAERLSDQLETLARIEQTLNPSRVRDPVRQRRERRRQP